MLSLQNDSHKLQYVILTSPKTVTKNANQDQVTDLLCLQGAMHEETPLHGRH